MSRLIALDAARPHVTAPARCVHCAHQWVAVVPDLPGARDNLECPGCGQQSDAAGNARVHKALAVLDDLREAVADGRVVAFAAVGIEPDDSTRMWSSCTADVSRLRVIGAIAHMGHMYSHGEDMDG